MTKTILFSLENCVKCTQTKELLTGRNDVEIKTFPHDIGKWTTDDLEFAKLYDVFDELKQTAPILWVDGKKSVGYLRIRKWLQDSKL